MYITKENTIRFRKDIRLSRKQMSLKKLADTRPIAALKDAPVKRVLREAFVCDRGTTRADIPFLG